MEHRRAFRPNCFRRSLLVSAMRSGIESTGAERTASAAAKETGLPDFSCFSIFLIMGHTNTGHYTSAANHKCGHMHIRRSTTAPTRLAQRVGVILMGFIGALNVAIAHESRNTNLDHRYSGPLVPGGDS